MSSSRCSAPRAIHALRTPLSTAALLSWALRRVWPPAAALGLCAASTVAAAAPASVPSPRADSAATEPLAEPSGEAATTGDALPLIETRAAAAQDVPVGTGSHLGLTERETPASVERITRATLETRGDALVIDAVSRATGISALPHPGNGGSALGARGFTDSGSVMQLYDGVRPYGALGVTYPFDTWAVDHIDVLRGPASVIYGEGAIGGVVNVVPKKPTQTPIENEVQLGIGTEGTARAAFGSGGAVNDRLSYRFDVSGNRSNNWVDAGDSRNLSISGALRFRVNRDVAVTLSHAQGWQHPMRYFGTPLIAGRFDPSTFSRNYNVGDALISYRDSWTTLGAEWRLGDGVSLNSTVYYMRSDRHWRNAEYYTWLPGTSLVERSAYTEILHEQRQVGNVTTLKADGRVFGMDNLFSAGVEMNHTTFQHTNNSGDPASSVVGIYGGDPGGFLNPDGTAPAYRTQANQYAFFAEDRLALNTRWSVVTGLRYDHANVGRIGLRDDGTAPLRVVFAHTGWRIGTVYDVLPTVSVYAQVSSAADPLGTILMLSPNAARYPQATGRQIEVGVKQTFLGGRGDWTLAFYEIVKRNLLSADPADPTQVMPVGRQSSRGVEASVGMALANDWRVDANLALLRARYDDFVDSSGGAAVSRAGNVPTDVPQQLANVWVSWRFAPQWTSTAGLRYVGRRFADNANTLSMGSYATVDASVAWRWRPDTTVTARVYNLFDKRYAQTAYYNATQWLLGNDRRVELVLDHRF
ncbi:TonB-dependent receptor [Chitinasiproducens palmae]|uniref:Iron complex outermembrane recepter protein n=1 Tax=Chitinasiproducens palmae TaxID=1770053 RepID=A0A1H2PVC7_9BURK|nr:TonB-dependent siderophore receptor [Chitinasiproducens palmae]SDV51197.1 iron complex outermembrane recepter protein [Chitinasiproducens palmae]